MHKVTDDSHRFGQPRVARTPFTAGQASHFLGDVLYAMLMPDGLVKIGGTSDIYARRRKLGDPLLLAIRAGDKVDELRVHVSLRDQAAAPGTAGPREYYRPTRRVLALVNAWRSDLGMILLDDFPDPTDRDSCRIG